MFYELSCSHISFARQKLRIWLATLSEKFCFGGIYVVPGGLWACGADSSHCTSEADVRGNQDHQRIQAPFMVSSPHPTCTLHLETHASMKFVIPHERADSEGHERRQNEQNNVGEDAIVSPSTVPSYFN